VRKISGWEGPLSEISEQDEQSSSQESPKKHGLISHTNPTMKMAS